MVVPLFFVRLFGLSDVVAYLCNGIIILKDKAL